LKHTFKTSELKPLLWPNADTTNTILLLLDACAVLRHNSATVVYDLVASWPGVCCFRKLV